MTDTTISSRPRRRATAAPHDEEGPGSPERPTVSLGQAAVLAGVVVIGILGWASLLLAHLGAHSGIGAVGLTVVLLLAVAVLVRRDGFPAIRVDVRELVLLGALAVLAAVMFFPGFPYFVGDKDPGVYVLHGAAISETGSVDFEDPVRVNDLPAVGFPGLWVSPHDADRILPQFFHLFPATLGTVGDFFGTRGIANLNPAFAVLSVLAVTLATTRAFGRLLPGALAGVLLSTNMMQVWGAKYPASEMMAQLLATGAVLGVVLAITCRWRAAAGAAGLLTGLAYLERPDGCLLLVVAALAGAALVAGRRWDSRATWFAVGALLPLPHALFQADVLAEAYSRANGVPIFWELGLLLAAPFVLAVLWRLLLAERVRDRWSAVVAAGRSEQVQRWVGIAMAAMAAAFVVFSFLRPWILGDHRATRSNGEIVRTFNERNMLRLSWFFTMPGIALMWAGAALVAVRRWRAAVWALVLPVGLLLPVYIYKAGIASRLMWWPRRYVSTAIVAIVILIAIALAAGLSRRGRGRLPLLVASTGLLVFLLAATLQDSLPLRDHAEYGGSRGILSELAGEAGDRQGVFLWERGTSVYDQGRILGGGLWLVEDQISAVLPKEATADTVRQYASTFPDSPVFVIGHGERMPTFSQGLELEQVRRLTGSFPFWEEANNRLPTKAGYMPYDMMIWRVRAT